MGRFLTRVDNPVVSRRTARYAGPVLAHAWRGSGSRVCVLLHGFLGSARNLGALARRWVMLDPSVRLLQVDLPGHGKSPRLANDANLVDLARSVGALLDELGQTAPVSVVGHSMGGRVALALRRTASERVAHITLLDITPGPTVRIPAGSASRDLLDLPDEATDREQIAAPLRAKGHSPAMVDWLLMNLVRDKNGYRWRIDRRALYDLHVRSSELDFWPEIEQAPTQTSLIRGSESAYVTEADIRRFDRLGVVVDTVTGAGHFLHVDRTDEVAALVSERSLDSVR